MSNSEVARYETWPEPSHRHSTRYTSRPVYAPARANYRRLISQSATAKVEDSSVSQAETPAGYCPEHQVVLPYEGLFAYSVGRRTMFVDQNQILLVGAREEYRDEHPLRDLGHAGVIITPAEWIVDELKTGSGLDRHGRISTGLTAPSARTRLITHRLLRHEPDAATLRADELSVAVVGEALKTARRPVSRSPRHVTRAKEMLHSYPGEKLGLEQIAAVVGVSPVYLSQLFTQQEGMPLYRYQLKLRLNRALLALPTAEDITHLAVELGFSSHSHFTATFRATFGMSPSAYRAELCPKASPASSHARS